MPAFANNEIHQKHGIDSKNQAAQQPKKDYDALLNAVQNPVEPTAHLCFALAFDVLFIPCLFSKS